jgi:uncharacterized protein with FMN-binding domain
MQSTPKIMVFQLKEIIYTIVFILLAILLVLLLIFMFLPDKDNTDETSENYTSGTYTASLVLNSMPMEVSVSVDDNYIKSVELKNLDESVAAMYPLLEPSLQDIESFVVANQSIENIYFENDNEYTGKVLAAAVETALAKAVKD